jgi:manganese-dependent ADP-ribose/CDP-alcohol diphosphatase
MQLHMPASRVFDIKLLLILTRLIVCNITFNQTCDSLPILKIGLIADPQYCDCDPAFGRYYRETLNKLPVAIDTLNKNKVDFVMNLGDMIDRFENSYDPIIQFYHELEMPYYNLLGNHEFEEVSEIYLSTLLTRYEIPNYFYDFSYGNWRFLVLDGTELGVYSRFLHPELAEESDSLWQNAQGNINDYPWNGGISRNQQSWIRNKLQEALNAEQNVILFCHFSVYPDTLQNSLLNSPQIIGILENYPNVTAFISGHQHEGSYDIKKGIHYLTQKAMVDTPDQNSFAILEIYSDEIRLKGYGNIEDVILSYENSKKKD